MLKIGLTGGIASGKSEATKIFASQQVPIIDADQVAHEILSHDSNIKQKVITHFGNDILTKNQKINRKALRNIIFQDIKEKNFLENLLHPVIIGNIQHFLSSLSKNKDIDYCIVVIPLLFETYCQKFIDKIIVIDSPIDRQIERVTKRDGINTQQAINIINYQISREQRLQYADYIIFNDYDLIDIHNDIIELDKVFKQN
tara:strand:- start:190 stop:789 length:600 start_codon:yes stop_codon:yes gene_type:complete